MKKLREIVKKFALENEEFVLRTLKIVGIVGFIMLLVMEFFEPSLKSLVITVVLMITYVVMLFKCADLYEDDDEE